MSYAADDQEATSAPIMFPTPETLAHITFHRRNP